MEKSSSLFLAAESGDVDAVQLLLNESPEDVDCTASHGSTSLLVACQAGHVEVARALVARSADVNRTAVDAATPLFVAAMQGHADVVSAMLDLSASCNAARSDGASPLYVASQRGHLEVLQLLLDVGADKDKQQRHGATPLLTAVESNQIQAVRTLLLARADTQLATRDGNTPLSAADLGGFPEIAELLTEVGATKEAHSGTHNFTVFCTLLLSVLCCAFWAFVMHLAHEWGWWDEAEHPRHHIGEEL